MNIQSNGSKWAGEEPDKIDVLIDVLKSYTLDPTFERYGNFVIPHEGVNEVRVWGNFFDVSHVFCIDGSPEELESVIQAIRENQKTDRYLSAKKALRIKRVRL